MAGVTTGNRALKGRASRKLPSIELPRSQDHSINRAFENIAEYLRTYEGDGTAPKERFVTMRELEEAGLVTLGTKNGYSFIAQVLKKDVAQTAGSTANPTLKGTVKKDTALGLRTPGGGGGGASNPLEQGKRGITQKLSDIGNVAVASPAQTDFLYYDGGKWKNFSLFKRENRWLKKQNFEAGISIEGVDFADHTHVIADITDFTDNSTNWDTAFGWGDHSVAGYAVKANDETITGTWTFEQTVTIDNAAPKLAWLEDDASADNGLWDMVVSAEQFLFRAREDGDTGGANIFTVDRTAAVVDNVTFGPVTIHTAGAYVYNNTPLRLYDATEANFAELEFNDEDQFGNLKLSGSTRGGYLGLSMDVPAGDTHTIMASTDNVGWYNDTDNHWLLRWADAGRTYFYLDGNSTSHLELQTYDATGATSGAQVRDHGGTLRDVGYNIMPLAATNSSITVRAEHVGKTIYSNNTTSYNITLDNSSDVPIGAVVNIVNFNNTGTLTVVDGSGITLYWLNNTGSFGSGNRTVGPNSVATVWRHSSGAWFIWGSNLS